MRCRLLLREQVVVIDPRRCPLRLVTQVVATEPAAHVELRLSATYILFNNSWVGAAETARVRCLWQSVHSTYQSPLAVGVVRKQVLARQRQVVRPDTVAWRLSLLHYTALSAPLPAYVEPLWRQRQQGRATPPVRAPT